MCGTCTWTSGNESNGPLENALRVRAEEIRAQRSRAIDAKRDAEERRLRGTLEGPQVEYPASPRRVGNDPRARSSLRLFDTEERRQFDADVGALRDRVSRIDTDIDTEVGILRRRYEVRDVKLVSRWAVEFLIPAGGN